MPKQRGNSFYSVVQSQAGTWHLFDSDDQKGFARTNCKRIVRERKFKEFVPLNSYSDLVGIAHGPKGGHNRICTECAWPAEVQYRG